MYHSQVFRAEGDNEDRGHLGEAVSELDRDAGAGRDAFQPSLHSHGSPSPFRGKISKIQKT
jgi:hypothetical protein